MPLTTNLSVRQIQLALYRHFKNLDIAVPNLSWGLLSYEADFIGISRNGQVTEVEIKRSLSDLRADFKKDHRHDEDCVTYFYYCVPESLEEKTRSAILENKRKTSLFPVSEKDCPALLTYNEEGEIRETDFGKAKRSGYHELSLEDRIQAGRLGTLRFWNLLEATIAPEDRGLQARIRAVQDENRTLKLINKNIEEDYNLMKRFLRYQHPEIWEEFLNIDSPEIKKLKEI